MARLDVYPMPGKGWEDFLLDIQAHLLSHLAIYTVVPLLPEDAAPRPISELNPVFDVRSKRHVMLTQAIASIPGKELKRAVASLTAQHDAVTRTLNTLLLGF